MDKTTAALREKQNTGELDDLVNENAKLQHELEIANTKLKWYEEQFRLNATKRFGKSSDTVPAEQLSFFNEAEITVSKNTEELTLETITYKRKQKRGTNKDSFKDLPVERIIYELSDGEKACETCHTSISEISEETRRELKIIPAKVCIVEHIRKVYTCKTCQQTGEKTPIVTAKMPAPVIAGSFASPSLVAYLMYQKYAAALPLDRQEKIFNDFGIELSKQNMANWIIKSSDLWLEPLYDTMRRHLIRETFVQADETPMRVLTKDGKPTDSKAYMWLYRTGKYGKPLVMYEYQPSRAGKHAKAFLEGFSGHLQTDDFAGYNSVENVTRVGCLAHARRYFTDAIKALPKEAKIESTHAHEALEFFKVIFTLESEYQKLNLSAKDLLEARIKALKPEFEAYLAWLHKMSPQVVPKSKLGKAIHYSLSNWELLTNIFEDGQCELSNNRAEQLIKKFVIGRKNYLFCKGPQGAKSSAIIYSIIETAKLNGLNPFNYLTYLFEELPNTRLENDLSLEHLLPWSNQLPESCHGTLNLKNE